MPDRIWTINDLTEEELRDLQVDLRHSDSQNKWWEYEPLKSLDLSSNSLTKLSENVKGLADLVNLDVRIIDPNEGDVLENTCDHEILCLYIVTR